MTSRKLHVAMVASPGMGHLIPVLLLGNRLITHHNLQVTVLAVTTTTSSAESDVLSTYTNKTQLQVIGIPAADISSMVSPDAKVVTRLAVMMKETVPKIRSVVLSMDPRPNVLIADIFATASFTVAGEFAMPKYVFVACNAWFTGLMSYSAELDKIVVGQYVDQTEPLNVPGCKPVRPEDVVDPMLDRADEMYHCYLGLTAGMLSADGMLVNTWEGLEPQSLDALRNNETLRSVIKNQPVYPIGPVCKRLEPTGSSHEAIKWLDKQPENSVIYVSFGSVGTLSAEQITELANGLEASGQRFLWVVRPPSGCGTDGSFFNAGCDPDSPQPDYFPEGFLTRVKNVGLLVPMWGPQVEILNHFSIGGFLTHCGWNSTLESIMSGVPMIAWPLYAEQRLNATLLVEELKVAVRPEVLPAKKVVGRDEVEKMVRTLMTETEEGKGMRKRVKELRDGAEEALDVNGSSYISMCNFIDNLI